MTPITVSGTRDSVETTVTKTDLLVELDLTVEISKEMSELYYQEGGISATA
jgi:hypothetical protein